MKEKIFRQHLNVISAYKMCKTPEKKLIREKLSIAFDHTVATVATFLWIRLSTLVLLGSVRRILKKKKSHRSTSEIYDFHADLELLVVDMNQTKQCRLGKFSQSTKRNVLS